MLCYIRWKSLKLQATDSGRHGWESYRVASEGHIHTKQMWCWENASVFLLYLFTLSYRENQRHLIQRWVDSCMKCSWQHKTSPRRMQSKANGNVHIILNNNNDNNDGQFGNFSVSSALLVSHGWLDNALQWFHFCFCFAVFRITQVWIMKIKQVLEAVIYSKPVLFLFIIWYIIVSVKYEVIAWLVCWMTSEQVHTHACWPVFMSNVNITSSYFYFSLVNQG